jgi:type I restriction enzyme S subunit
MVTTAQETKVKAGYKLTEVGMIPEEWDVKRLEELGYWRGGATPSMANTSFWINGTIYWASSGDVKTKLLSKTANMITETAVKQSSTTLLQKGAILIVTRSGILRKYLPVAINTVPMAINQDIKALISNSQTSADYLLQMLSARGPDILTTCMKSGTTVESIEYNWLKKYQIPLPAPDEQQAIATALSDVDALLTSLDKLIVKKRDIKQATTQQLLTGKIRLPGFSGEWKVKRLGEIGKIYGGLSGKSKEDFVDGQYPYIPFLNIMKNPVIDTNYLDYVNIAPGESQNQAAKGDLFFNGSSETPEEVGMCSMLNEAMPNLYLNSFCFGFRLNKELAMNGLYLSYYFRSNIGRQLFYSLAQGATRYNLSKSNFLNMEISYPGLEEQQAIATVLSDMDAEIAALEQRREKTRALKQGMMQELLTGRIRLL